MSILDRILGNPEYIVVDHRAYDVAIKNLRKNNYRPAFVRKCFAALYENGTIITMDKFRAQQQENVERRQRMAEWVAKRKMMRPVTQRRLKKMCRYFCKPGTNVYVEYEYNNSMGCHEIRSAKGHVQEWDVKSLGIGGQKEFTITLNFANGAVFQESFHESAMFTGLGKIEECNSGPYCYFTMRFA